MKRLISAASALLLGFAVLATSGAFAGSAATAGTARGGDHPYGGGHHDYSFERFLRRYEAANTAFVNGNPQPWMSIVAERDPQSIFGGFGGLGESGAAEVNQRYQLAARAFQPGGTDVDFEYLVKDVRGKLAYTVAIERSEVVYTGQTERRPQILRATMIFRYERGAWKIVHRHADHMIDLELPGSD